MDLRVKPIDGTVLRYSFLWSHEHKAGLREGAKDRACVVVMSSSDGRILLAPITSRPPEKSTSIDLPLEIKRHLGLDERKSWVIASNLNKFTWPGFDIRSVPGKIPATYSYGRLPAGFLLQIQTTLAGLAKKRLVATIERDEGPS